VLHQVIPVTLCFEIRKETIVTVMIENFNFYFAPGMHGCGANLRSIAMNVSVCLSVRVPVSLYVSLFVRISQKPHV